VPKISTADASVQFTVVPSVKKKQLIQTTFFWRTGELARAYFRSQNEKRCSSEQKRCSSEQKKRERVARAPLKSCFFKLSKLFPILKRMGEKSRYAHEQWTVGEIFVIILPV
jgi:hypothetical protein